ncbi:hypothetical protein DSM25558_0583 [Agrobacterium sp. DSM 25558]|uniref:hypothetical protein n=1 Tax=Agrobacterium sp. DSM 25558 TaxID=1907665 RepID=UPI0009724E1A|nr:hypothetical protein [Agrobacterium sp. DSM 25558]SCX03913.1 hypothetical protein DSM25558_0583 [Agrobacterium sp. DSM 25558]
MLEKFIAINTLLFFCVFPQVTMASEPYPCDPNSTSIGEKVPADYLVVRELGAHKLKVPYGYLTPRERETEVNCYPKRQKLEFSFWMPDLAPAAKDPWFSGDLRPKEPNRSSASQDSYLVKVIGAWYVAEGADDYVNPETRFKNSLNGPQGPYPLETVFGLTHIIEPQGTLSFDGYGQVSEDDFKIQIDCIANHQAFPNPNCKAHLRLTDLNVNAVLLFPVDALPQWRAVKDAVHSLMSKWIVEAK